MEYVRYYGVDLHMLAPSPKVMLLTAAGVWWLQRARWGSVNSSLLGRVPRLVMAWEAGSKSHWKINSGRLVGNQQGNMKHTDLPSKGLSLTNLQLIIGRLVGKPGSTRDCPRIHIPGPCWSQRSPSAQGERPCASGLPPLVLEDRAGSEIHRGNFLGTQGVPESWDPRSPFRCYWVVGQY